MSNDWYTKPQGWMIPKKWKLTEENREYLDTQAWNMILLGNDCVEEYLDTFGEELEEAGVKDKKATKFFEAMIAERRAQQQALGGVPASKLAQAFAELETIGVVARENFSCCGTCGSGEIWEERDDTRVWRGYVYYHQQDAENILESRETYVGYGAFPDAAIAETEWKALDEAEKEQRYEQLVTALMTDEVIPILEKHGIGVSWDGSLGTRILLSDVDLFIAV